MKLVMSGLIALFASLTPSATQDDVVFTAMKDEMNRSVKRLHLEGHALPYYISYTVHDVDTFAAGATFGALTERSRDHARNLNVDVRIGDYKLDSTSGSSELGHLMGGSHANAISVDNDYPALRRELWLKTDAAYKHAIENLESKKTYLKQNTVEDRPDSFSREQPVEHIEPIATLNVDADKWARNLRDLSGVFRDYPKIRSSHAAMGAVADTHWFLNNEGFRNRVGEKAYTLTITASAQSEDGMRFSDQEMVPSYTENGLPSMAEMKTRARALADRLTKLCTAPKPDDYRGPVLFEGQSAAQFFHDILDPKLSGTPGDSLSHSMNDMSDKIGQRFLPNFINVVDDPNSRAFGGQTLFGFYDVDDDGLKGQKITLIEKGILKTLCMSRIPNRAIARSNGHSKRGVGATSNLFINSESKLSPEALKARLIQLGKEDGLKEVYIARRIASSPNDLDFSNLQSFLKSFLSGSGGASLFPPVLLYKVSTVDGHEVLTRGGIFTNVSMRILRDIDATGNDTRAYPVQNTRDITSIITPSVLVKEVEIQKPEKSNSKPPILKNPNFDK